MPQTPKGRKILASMQRQYGPERGKRVFYGSINKGTIHGTGTRTEARRRRKHRRSAA